MVWTSIHETPEPAQVERFSEGLREVCHRAIDIAELVEPEEADAKRAVVRGLAEHSSGHAGCNRRVALSMEGIWRNGRLPRVERWFERVSARPTFRPAFLEWVPAELTDEMRANGQRSWPAVAALLAIPV